ncbi:MAG: hypothetical protein JXQ73_32905 [Phycisphaerae bacterium]|nr:hypothetical protein [Phycisphaerae bacterium]
MNPKRSRGVVASCFFVLSVSCGAVSVQAALVSIAGQWNSAAGPVTIEHASNYSGQPLAIKGYWIHKRNKAIITGGTYDPVQRKAVAQYYLPWKNMYGKVTWMLAEDGKALFGQYQQPDSQGVFHLYRGPVPSSGSKTSSGGAKLYNVAGQWTSSWGTVTIEHGKLSSGQAVKVTGYWTQNGKTMGAFTSGSYDANKRIVEAAFKNAKGGTGKVRWTLSTDGNTLSGLLTMTGRSDTGKWDLQRAKRVAAAVATAGGSGGVSGTWDSSFGTVYLKHGPLQGTRPVNVTGYWTQNNSRMGSFTQGIYYPDKGIVDAAYQNARGAKGNVRWRVSRDGRSMSGEIVVAGRADRGTWNMTRK